MDAPFPAECCPSTNMDAQFTAECCASVNVDAPFATGCCSPTNIYTPFAAEYCSPTNTDAPFPAECCTPTNADALSTFSSSVAQCFEGDSESFGDPLQTPEGFPPVAYGNFIEARSAKVVAISILHLFGHHEAFRYFLILDAFLVVPEECLIGIPLLLGLQHAPMQDDVIQSHARQQVD